MGLLGQSGAIYAAEAAGQKELVESDSLPAKCRDDVILESWGFKFGEPFKDDPLFRPAQMPEGWKKEATDHDMHSNILDRQGRVRIGIFYKAAFYDRRADMNVKPRYDTESEFHNEEVGDASDVTEQVWDRQTGKMLFELRGTYSTVMDGVREWMKTNLGEDHRSPDKWTE